MDFLDPQKKRSHTIRLIVGYCLVAIALILASLLLLFAAFGYGINRSTGEVIQNGLVFVDSHPEQATMYLNGQDKGGTDGRFVLEAGNYNLELKRDGYRPWKRDFVLDGGNIVRLVYPFLFPEKLDSKDVLSFTTPPDMVSESPDRRFIVIHVPDALTTFQVMDASTKQFTTTSIVIPQAVLGTHSGTQRMEAVEWSTDNRHLLVKYSFDGGNDYIVLDRQTPAESYSVSQTFGKTFSSVTFHDKKFDQLYVHDVATGQLQLATTKDKLLSPVVTDVLAFWPYKDSTIMYTTNLGAADGKSLLKVKDGQAAYTIREVTRGAKYLLNMAEFDGDTYIIGGSAADGKVYVYKNPLAVLKKQSGSLPLPVALLKVDNPEYATFSANTRFISVQGGSRFALYDFETKLQYKYDTQLPLTTGQKAIWMDGHRLMVVSQGKMVVFDYDNLNRQTLVATADSYVPLFDRDYNQLFTVGPTAADASKTGLIRTDLNLGKE
jgi:hypothetical protein